MNRDDIEMQAIQQQEEEKERMKQLMVKIC
jgi:hypothetical protein